MLPRINPPDWTPVGMRCYLARMSSSQTNHLVFAAMRDEGAFLVEWVCWYRMLGFKVLIGINDCTDHSPQILQLLQEAGWVDFYEHTPGPRQAAKASAYAGMVRQPAFHAADWLFVCDADEFLVLADPELSIGQYLDAHAAGAMGLIFYWKCFGNGGWRRYREGLVHRQFRRCAPEGEKINAKFKMIYRNPQRFRRHSDHSPYEFDGDWSAPENRIVDCEGRPVPQFLTEPHPVRYTDSSQITHATAQLNHYVIRSNESFDLKRGAESASAKKDRYTQFFFRRHNRNDKRDRSALAFEARFDAVFAEAMALPGLKRLHNLACADHVQRICNHNGRRAAKDERWTKFMDQALAV